MPQSEETNSTKPTLWARSIRVEFQVLISTDVLARGIDVPAVTLAGDLEVHRHSLVDPVAKKGSRFEGDQRKFSRAALHCGTRHPQGWVPDEDLERGIRILNIPLGLVFLLSHHSKELILRMSRLDLPPLLTPRL